MADVFSVKIFASRSVAVGRHVEEEAGAMVVIDGKRDALDATLPPEQNIVFAFPG
jgi:uncharacterized protein (DUF1330 family)